MVIFLDIDGVLNCESDWVNKFFIRQSCVKVLGKLAQTMGCTEIVLSSTWRACEGGTEPEFYKNLKRLLAEQNLNIVGTTPISSNHTRKEEILYYVKRHDCGQYLILDDDPSVFGTTSDIPIYLTSHLVGLTETDINSVYKMWKRFWR